jgi:hypothetical protein
VSELTAHGTPNLAGDASSAEAQFLDSLRRRVSWQSEKASRLRGGVTEPGVRELADEPVDVHDVSALGRLIDSRPDDPRAPEWRAFLDDLRILADSDGRLHEDYGCLVRAVLGDLVDKGRGA